MQLVSTLWSFLWLAGALFSAAAFVAPHPGANTHGTRDKTCHHLDLGSMIQNFGKKATVSHILIGPSNSKSGRGMRQDDAIAKLVELKAEIGDDPDKFAAAAEEFSTCRASMDKGGDLGEYGPGLMVGPVDKICFNEEVGKVHGPVSSPYGEHLILIRERTGEN